MFVSDDQFDSAQSAIRQRAQEFVPEHLGFAGLNGDAQNLAPPIQIDRHGHYGCHTGDPPGASHLDVSGVQPEIASLALQRSVKEGVNAFVDFDAQARDLALGNARHAHGLHKVVH